jgi:TonB family protein
VFSLTSSVIIVSEVKRSYSSMAHQPIWGPNPYRQPVQSKNRGLSPNGGKEVRSGTGGQDRTTENVAELTARLASYGGGESSANLALDLVLNDMAEQARMATLASRALIAVLRGDELICRAVAGDSTARLGTRLDTDLGLCGDCIRTHQAQFCDDTETDTRIEAKASRLLGIRSIAALPIIDGTKLVGILELFWLRPYAAGDPEMATLQSLCAVIVNKLRSVAGTVVLSSGRESFTSAPSAGGVEHLTEPAAKPFESSKPTPHVNNVSEPEQEEEDFWPWEIEEREKRKLLESRPRQEENSYFQLTPVLKDTDGNGSGKRGRDYWTSILTAVVIALALLLGWMVGRAGWEMAVDKASERTPAVTPGTQIDEPATPTPPSAAVTKNSADDENKKAKAKPDLPSEAADTGKSTPATNSKPPSKTPTHEVSAGGLVVYEKGKVVFQMPATPKSAQPTSTSARAVGSAEQTTKDPSVPLRVSSDTANSYLLHRVEPQYPEQAKLEHIEGPVILAIVIGTDGLVKNLSVVSGDLQLVNAATDAVRQWRFKPYILNGKTVDFETRVTVNFALPSD